MEDVQNELSSPNLGGQTCTVKTLCALINGMPGEEKQPQPLFDSCESGIVLGR